MNAIGDFIKNVFLKIDFFAFVERRNMLFHSFDVFHSFFNAIQPFCQALSGHGFFGKVSLNDEKTG